MIGDARQESVRRCVLETFAEFGVQPHDLDQMTDTLLIRDGRYCGRSFRAGGLMAMWISSLVQFYGAGGQMLRTVRVSAPATQNHGKAA